MKTWQSLTNSLLPLRLRYPDPTPQGAPTIAREMETETSYRVHLTSEGTDEVYFEVGCYASLPIDPASALNHRILDTLEFL